MNNSNPTMESIQKLFQILENQPDVLQKQNDQENQIKELEDQIKALNERLSNLELKIGKTDNVSQLCEDTSEKGSLDVMKSFEVELSGDIHKNRFFKIIDAKTGASYGRYTGDTPEQAASKAFTQLLQKMKEEGKAPPEQTIIYLREATRGSARKIYGYEAFRQKLKEPQKLTIRDKNTGEEKEIVYHFRNKLKEVAVPDQIGGIDDHSVKWAKDQENQIKALEDEIKALGEQNKALNERLSNLELKIGKTDEEKCPKCETLEFALKANHLACYKLHYNKLINRDATQLCIDASKNGSFDVVKFLVELGADIHTMADYLVRWASDDGHLDMVKFLVEKGANIHALNDHPLRCASKKGHLEMVKFLVESGANIHAISDHAVQWASENGHLEVVKFLVSLGANIHADDDCAVRWASENGHLEVVKFLVESGANIHADKDSAVRLALEKNQMHMVKYLVSLWI